MGRLRKYLPEEIEPNASNLAESEKLQIAFLRTFPMNICISPEQNYQEYPYYLLVQSKKLMKVHGSSLMNNPRLPQKPKWICCQNIVISSVTKREMTKVIVPINEKLLYLQDSAKLKKAVTLSQTYKISCVEFKKVQTSLLRFYRRKNHIDFFKSLLKKHEVYLETEEEIEKVLYFYLAKKGEDEKIAEEIKQVNTNIGNEARMMMKKRHATIKVSERTKLQVNENSQIIDILNEAQYLGLLIRSANDRVTEIISEVAKKLQIDETQYSIDVNKQSDIQFVYLLDKHTAEKFRYVLQDRLIMRSPSVPVYPLLGGTEEFGNRFKKWKFVMNWYEGIPDDIIVNIFEKTNLDNFCALLDSLNNKSTIAHNRNSNNDPDEHFRQPYKYEVLEAEVLPNFNQAGDDEEESNIKTGAEVKLTDFLPHQFSDLIEFEDFMWSKLKMKEGPDYHMRCARKHKPKYEQQDPLLMQAVNFFVGSEGAPLEIDIIIEDLKDEIESIDIQNRTSEMDDLMGTTSSTVEQNDYQEPRASKQKGKSSGKQGKGSDKNQQSSKSGKNNQQSTSKGNILAAKRSELDALIAEREKSIETYQSIIKNTKELRFIQENKMDKSIALVLDYATRIRLEQIFPQLVPLNILVFKPNEHSIVRTAYIYPNPSRGDHEYIEIMRDLLNHNRGHCDKLGSRLKLAFRGKYFIKINVSLWNNFGDTIKNILYKLGMKEENDFFIKEATLKVELKINTSVNNHKTAAQAYEKIAEILKAEEYVLDANASKGTFKNADAYDYYAFFSNEGDKEIQKFNNINAGELYIESDLRFRRIYIRGLPDKRSIATKNLTDLFNDFNSFVRSFTIPLTDIQGYNRVRKAVQDAARQQDMHVLFNNSREKPALTVFTNRFEEKNQRLASESNAINLKLDRLKQQIDQLIGQKQKSYHDHNRVHEKCCNCLNKVLNPFRLLYCSHIFCQECLKQDIESKTHYTNLKCSECDEAIALFDILYLFSQAELEIIFSKFKYEFMIDNKDRFRACPAPNCQNVLEKTPKTNIVFCTSCGYDCCFFCGKQHYFDDCAALAQRTSRATKRSKTPSAYCPDCRSLLNNTTEQGSAECITCKKFYCIRCPKPLQFASQHLIIGHISKTHGLI